MSEINSYRQYGLVLCLAGAVFAPVAYFIIDSVPLCAAGISAIIVGLTCLALSDTRPGISPEASNLLLQTGMQNTAALLEELGIRSKAIYMPASGNEYRAQALVPLTENADIERLKTGLPGRLIVRYGNEAWDIGLGITTPGTIGLEMLETPPSPTVDSITASLNYIFSGRLDIARMVDVKNGGSSVTVTIHGTRWKHEEAWYYRCLGSPLASIAAAVTSQALGKPVRITEEKTSKNSIQVVLEVLP